MLPVMLCQKRVLERDCETGGERSNFFFAVCFLFLLGLPQQCFFSLVAAVCSWRSSEITWAYCFVTLAEPTSLHSFRNTDTSQPESTLQMSGAQLHRVLSLHC